MQEKVLTEAERLDIPIALMTIKGTGNVGLRGMVPPNNQTNHSKQQVLQLTIQGLQEMSKR